MALYLRRSDGRFEPVRAENIRDEKQLEKWLVMNPDLLFKDEEILWIDQEKPLEQMEDLLGIDSDGNTVVVELKRDKAPREVIAQALDYASRIASLSHEELNQRALQFFKETGQGYSSLREAYLDYFSEDLEDQDNEQIEFNRDQRIVIAGQRIDESVRRMARYLSDHGIDIRCIEFTYYKTEKGEELLETDEDVSPPPPPPPDYREFLERIREQVLADLGDSFKPIRVTQKPRNKLLLEISSLVKMGFQIRARDEKYRVIFCILPRRRGNQPEIAQKIYQFLKAHSREIESQLGSVEWIESKPISRLVGDGEVPLKYPKEELADRLAPAVAERVEAYIKTILPILEEGRKAGQITW